MFCSVSAVRPPHALRANNTLHVQNSVETPIRSMASVPLPKFASNINQQAQPIIAPVIRLSRAKDGGPIGDKA